MSRIFAYFINNRLVVNMLLVMILIIGAASLLNLKQEIFPPTDIDTMIVYLKYPGAGALDVEMNSVVPVEEELEKINGIADYVSLSAENGAIIYIYLDQDISSKTAVKNEIYRNLQVVPDMPPEVEDLTIIDANPKMMSVLTIGLTLKNRKQHQEQTAVKKMALFSEKFKNKLRKIKGVSEIRMAGKRENEIQVAVHPAKMEQYYVSLNDIISSIQRRNVRSTGGTLQSVTREKNVVTIGEFETPAEAGAVIIRSSFEEKRVRIKDVADIKEGFEKAETMVRVNRSPGVTLSIVKKENADVVETVRRVKKWLRQNSNIIPKNLKLNIIDDRSLSIIALLNVVKSNALIGFILVFIILFIFLDLRSAFWTAFGIPVTILMILSVMNFFDISLNIISLGAVITVLGMLVDHGIVISENIYSSRLKGLTGIQAALQGLKEVFTPVVITILTTIAAFLPLLFIKGMMGKFIYIYPIIITIALSASFIEAVFFLPNHLAHARQHSEQMIVPWFEAVISFYKKVLRQVIRYRYLVAAAFIIIFILTFVISRGTIKNYTLFWDNSSDAFYINLEAPQGTSLAQTAFLTKKIEQIVTSEIKKKERLSIRTIIGHHTVKRIRSRGNHENWSQITVFLKPQTERERNVEQIIRALRKKINPKKIKSFDRIMFAKQTVGPSPGKALEIKVVGGAEHDRYAAAAAVEKFLLDQNGVIDVDNDHKKGKEELKIVFDYNRLAKLNMDVASVARTVRTAYEGTVATSMQTMGEEIDFRVMIAEPYKKDSAFLKKLLIPNKQGKLIRLGDIAAFKAAATEAMLNHYNGERAVTLTAKVDRRQTTAGLVMHTLKKQFNNVPEKYNGVYLVEKGESAETTASARDLLIAFSIALLAIYLILVLLFNSLIQPVIILITVPFGLTGALLSFTAHSIPLNFMGLIGIIGLSGVVVNDSVVMVSFINTLIKEKKQGIILENIIQGASLRLRPVILTTLTTAAGLFPTVYGIGGSVSSLRPTVMGLSYGILFATLLTLFLIPALYVIAADLKQKSGSS